MIPNEKQTYARILHPDWPECLADLMEQWSCFIDLGEYRSFEGDFSEDDAKIERRICEMDDRFIHTFYPDISLW